MSVPSLHRKSLISEQGFLAIVQSSQLTIANGNCTHYTRMQRVSLDILAVPLAVVDEMTKSRGAVTGPGAMRTAQISTCPMPSLVVYNMDSYPTAMLATLI